MRYRIALCTLVLCLAAVPAMAGDTLSSVLAAGVVRCGVSTGSTGFSERGPDGVWKGIDVDFCRAVAAAAVGDATKVSFKALPILARFPALMSGEVDILARNATWTLGREVTLGIAFTGALAYSPQGVLATRQSGITTLADLDNKKICVVRDSTQDASLNYWAGRKGFHLEKVPFDSDEEARDGFFRGDCQAYASDALLLAGLRLSAPGGKDAYALVEDDLTMDPMSPAVRQGDKTWRQLVQAVWASLLLAEEFGLKQADFLPGATDSPAREIFARKADALAKALGIAPGWAGRAVASAGNYGEMFQRNLGEDSPLGLPRGPNRLWSQGGLMIPPDF